MTGRDVCRMAQRKAEALGRTREFMSFGAGKAPASSATASASSSTSPDPLRARHVRNPGGLRHRPGLHMMSGEGGVVKLEDMVLVGEEANEFLTKTPRRLFEV